jgi:outer membrane receptor protein involved in Fe transport
VDADLKDEFFYSDRHHVKSNSDYTLLNASAHWQIGSVDLRLWARNLTDEDYSVRAFGSFGNDPRKGYVTEPYFQWGEPRMIGANITLNW